MHRTLPLFLLGALCQAQDGAEPKFTSDVITIIAPTTVVDRKGNLVNGIPAHQFRLLDNKKEQKIRVDLAFQPLDIVVVMQANANVEPMLEKMKKIGPLLEGLVLGEKGECALIAFDHRIRLLQDFTSDGGKITKALETVRPGSSSSRLNDAVLEGARLLSKRPKDRRRVILQISETRDKGSEGRARETLLALQFGNIAVYTVNINRLVTTVMARTPIPRPDPVPTTARHLPGGAAVTPETVAQYTGANFGSVIPLMVEIYRQGKAIFVDNPAELYTKASGGKEHAFTTMANLENAISDIGEELHSQYLISYTPNNMGEGGLHEIQVLVDRPDLKIRTRQGYWMAAKFN